MVKEWDFISKEFEEELKKNGFRFNYDTIEYYKLYSYNNELIKLAINEDREQWVSVDGYRRYEIESLYSEVLKLKQYEDYKNRIELGESKINVLIEYLVNNKHRREINYERM